MKHTDIEYTTTLIFDRLYMVRIPEYAARSVEYMRIYGTYVTGIPEIDRAAPNNWLTTYLSIAKMAEHYKEGVTVAIVKYDDLKTIYDSITQHLSAWKHHIQTTINLTPPPIEDLIVLDEFAATVFQFAKNTMSNEAIQSLFAQSLEEMAVVKHSDFLKPYMPITATDPTKPLRNINSLGFLDTAAEDPEPKKPDRESYRDYFKIRQVIERPRT